MATVKLLIKSKKKESLATVYLRFRQGNLIDQTVPTQFKMYPEYWNNISQSFKSKIMFTQAFTPIDKDQLEIQFRNLKTFILNKMSSGQEMSKQTLSQMVYEYHHPTAPIKSNISFNEYINKFIKDSQKGVRLTEKSTLYRYSTIKSMKAFNSQFILYQEVNNKTLTYEDINMTFYTNFISFFNKKNYSPNSIGKHIRMLKFFMRNALDDDLHKNIDFNKRKFRTPSSVVQAIYLNEDEIKKMNEFDLSDDPNLKKACDVFLIGCYTAQRFSDYSCIKKDQIKNYGNGIKVIELVQKKTNEPVIIPIRAELEKILTKYDFSVPMTNDDKVNLGIKEVGRLLGFDEPVVIDKYQGGEKVRQTTPKYKLIQTHTARRSGCTNMYLAGIPAIDIMKISGHKTEKEFLKYIKVTKRQTAIGLAGHEYFKGK